MATLYVRNVPPELYENLKRWAGEAGHSVNAEILDVLEREAEQRERQAGFERKLKALRRKLPRLEGPPWPEDLIREDRDRGHKPELGY